MSIGSAGSRRPYLATAAALAAANPVLAAGQEGYATDTGLLKKGDGVTAWAALPSFEPRTDPARAENTAAHSGISAVVDMNMASITFTVGAIPWGVRLYVPTLAGTVAGDLMFLAITDEANTETGNTPFTIARAAGFFSLIAEERITAAGTYTRKGRLYRNTGTGTLSYGAASATIRPHYIEAKPLR